MNLHLAIAIVAIIVIIYTLLYWNTTAYEGYLYGFWAASGDDFCAESEIDSMMVFIGEAECTWKPYPWTRTRPCYVIIMNDLCNQGFTLSYRPSITGVGLGMYCIWADVVFDDEDIWPGSVSICVDMRVGTMKIYAGDTIYAKLQKQHDTTNLASECAAAELIF